MSALGVTGRDATVCLRCQYAAAIGKRPLIRKRPILAEPVVRSFQARHLTVRHGLRQAHAESHVDYNDTRTFVPRDSKLGSGFYRSTFEERRAGIRRLRGDSTKLDVQALGQPAEILIVRDWHVKKGRYDQPSQEEEALVKKSELEENLSPSEILDTVAAERGIIDSDGVCQNIQSLKETWLSKLGGTHTLPTDTQYNGLAKALHDGFTVAQLETYIASTKLYDRPQPGSFHRRYSAGDCLLYPWIPGSTPFPAGALSRLKSTDPPAVRYQAGLVPGAANEELNLTRKQAVVGTILRRAWSLRTKEELQSIGELDMEIQPLHLDLLLNHSMFH